MKRRSLTALVAISSACTTFDGLEVPRDQNDAGPIDGSAVRVGMLDARDAARLCSRALACLPETNLFQEMTRAFGLPLLSRADATTFSACLAWLAGPIGGDRNAARAQLQKMADAPTCAAAFSEATCRECAPSTNRCETEMGDGAIDAVVTCNDDVVRVCTPAKGEAHEVDCKLVGRSCTRLRQSAFCLRPDAACRPYELGIDRCDGDNRIIACVDGEVTSIDCEAFGFKRCQAGVIAHCRP